jgi:hypothetical protein
VREQAHDSDYLRVTALDGHVTTAPLSVVNWRHISVMVRLAPLAVVVVATTTFVVDRACAQASVVSLK